MNRGFWAAVGAFLIWGLLPLYLRQLHEVPALQIMAHRLLWCCLFVNIWLLTRGEFGKLRFALAVPATRWRLLATAFLVSLNWLIYVWGVNNGHVVETSLGYFINPLVNVLLGVVVLRERLNRVQWSAVALAAAGVIYLTWLSGAPPWIALSLAITFSCYGLIRKMVAVDAITGLGAETLLIAPLGLAYLLWLEAQGSGQFGHAGRYIDSLLFLGGLVTAVPLALFAFGARLIPYSTIGLIQYIGPTLQLLLGVFLFREPFTGARAIGFGLIWAALVVYAAEGLIRARRLRQATLAATATAGAPAASGTS
ncbi:MAG: EamA family transporter RarD [Nevskia sp.]|nr:EamA family transporter RarD [Nevskia sp.]